MRAFIFFLFILNLTLLSCESDPCVNLDRDLRRAARSEGEVSCEKLNEISIKYIEDQYDVDCKLDKDYDLQVLIEYAEKIGLKVGTCGEANPDPDSIKFKVYIENSASMLGYYSRSSQLEKALQEIFNSVEARVDRKSFSFNYINSQVYPAKVSLETFVRGLDPEEIRKYGDISKSELNNVFQMILDAHELSTVSILVSDFIYSLGDAENTQNSLQEEQGTTETKFIKKLKALGMSTLIVKMNSDFTGHYYTLHDTPIKLENKPRPYYLSFIASPKEMRSLIDNVFSIKELPGYQQYVLLEANSIITDELNAMILSQATSKVGSFRPSRAGNGLSIESVQASTRVGMPGFKLMLGVNLEGCHLEEGYILDTANYRADQGFIVKEIKKIEDAELSITDSEAVKDKCTHVITLFAEQLNFSETELNIALLQQIPSWIEQTNSDDDDNIEQQLDQTFGFKYLMGGIYGAYKKTYPDNEEFFSVSIKLKK